MTQHLVGVSIIDILKIALDEDLGAAGDITSMALFEAEDAGKAVIRAKQKGVLSGAYLIAPLFETVDSHRSLNGSAATKTKILRGDGDVLEPGDVICEISGTMRSILTGERVILNLLQRLSGIATATAAMVAVLKSKGGATRLLDTRKTTPGLRALEKAAVAHGGGVNHRFGLYDMILIKDTHVKRAGGVTNALTKALARRDEHGAPPIEIEVQSFEEFCEALPLGPDRIMLDNMSPDQIAKCVDRRNTSGLKTELEASGNVSLATLPAIAETGVDFVSSGAITHSAPALDIHLIIV